MTSSVESATVVDEHWDIEHLSDRNVTQSFPYPPRGGINGISLVRVGKIAGSRKCFACA